MNSETFKELLIEFLDSKVLLVFLYIYMFALVTYLVYCTLNYFRDNSKMRQRFFNLRSQLSESERERMHEEKILRDIQGESLKKDFLSKIDEELAYTGLKVKFRWLSTELFVIASVILALFVTTVVMIFGGVVAGLVAGVLTIFIIRLAIIILVNIRNSQTELIMLQLMNIMMNLSKSSDSLINVLERSSRYIDEPLSSQIYSAVVEARNTSDSFEALKTLQDNVKNKHFKMLIRNLEISSRYESNYADIINDCSVIFHAYIKSEKEKRNIRSDGAIQIVTMVVVGIMAITSMSAITDSGDITQVLMATTIGKAIGIYSIFSIVASIYILVFKVLRGTK